MMERLDELRMLYPDLGFSIFAAEPGQLVTLEVYDPDETVYSWTGPTVASVLERAFQAKAEAPRPDNIFD